MNSKDKVIQLIFDYFGGEETILIPFDENIDDENVDTFEELKKKWESLKWGFHGNVIVKLINLKPDPKVPGPSDEEEDAIETLKDINFDETHRCTEFDIWCFKSLMIDPEHYNRPFEKNPNGDLFSSRFAVECMEGSVYSKDFAFFECCSCGRTICQQDPSNGWYSQYRDIEDGQICLKCFEEDQSKNGVDIDEVIRTQRLKGMFFNKSELEEKKFKLLDGWDSVQIGMGRVSSTDPSSVFERLAEERDAGTFKNKIVIINYESMAIGGLGGYISIYVKRKRKPKKS